MFYVYQLVILAVSLVGTSICPILQRKLRDEALCPSYTARKGVGSTQRLAVWLSRACTHNPSVHAAAQTAASLEQSVTV